MTSATRRRPHPSEYFEYYHTYVSEVPDGDIVTILRRQMEDASALLSSVPKERTGFTYAPGKWTLNEVVGHVLDMEWVFTARALHFARAVDAALPGVEQDDVMKVSNFPSRPLDDIVDQWRHLRAAGTLFFEALDDAAWDRAGTASGRRFTVRAFPYIIAGHANHHLDVIRNRYLK
jgi:DinB superfamily